MEKLVSVIMPTYNRASFIGRAIFSVINQTYKNIELIICDDGSADNTKNIVEDFIKKDNRIKYIFNENSGGPSVPKNNGIKASSGDYITFLDSDDEFLLDKIEKEINKFNENSSIDLIHSSGFSIRNNTKQNIKSKSSENYFDELLNGNFILSDFIIKKDSLNNIIFDEKLKFMEDWEMLLNLSKNNLNFYFINENFLNYYIHENNITKKTNYNIKIESYNYIIDKYKEYYNINIEAYCKNLRNIATLYLLNNQYSKCINTILSSIKINKKDLRNYINFFVSIFGKHIYLFLMNILKKINKEHF